MNELTNFENVGSCLTKEDGVDNPLEQLKRRRKQLMDLLGEVDEAILNLESNPEFVRCYTTLKRVRQLI